MPIYGYTDEDGNEIDVMKVLTVIVPVMIEGDSGETELQFQHHRQYQFEEVVIYKTRYNRECELTDTITYANHYKVVTDDDTYYLPHWFAVIEGKLRSRDQQDVEKWKQKKADQPRNSRKEFLKVTGIDIDETLKPRYNGAEEYKQALKHRKDKTDIPYGYEEDKDYEQTY